MEEIKIDNCFLKKVVDNFVKTHKRVPIVLGPRSPKQKTTTIYITRLKITFEKLANKIFKEDKKDLHKKPYKNLLLKIMG